MKRTKINHQHVINIHPDIVVTSEIEHLSSLVPKPEMSFETIREVVVNRRRCGVSAVVAPTNVIEGEKSKICVSVNPSPRTSLRQRQREWNVYSVIGVVKPGVESSGGANVISRTCSRVRVHWRPVGSNSTALGRAPSIYAVALGAAQSFFVVSVRTKRQLEIRPYPPVGLVCCSSRSRVLDKLPVVHSRTLLHCIGSLVTDNSLNVLYIGTGQTDKYRYK